MVPALSQYCNTKHGSRDDISQTASLFNPVVTSSLLCMLLFMSFFFFSSSENAAEYDKSSGGCNHVAAMSMQGVIMAQHSNQNM